MMGSQKGRRPRLFNASDRAWPCRSPSRAVSNPTSHDPRQCDRGWASLGQRRQLDRRPALDHAVATGGSAVSCLFEEAAGTVRVARLITGTKHPSPEHVGVRLSELHLATTAEFSSFLEIRLAFLKATEHACETAEERRHG